MRAKQIIQTIRVTIVALLAFVLVFAPLSHAIAMSAGHNLTSPLKVASVAAVIGNKHHQMMKSETIKQSPCDESSEQSKSKKNCCDMGCLSVANFVDASDFFVALAVSVQYSDTDQQVYSRSVTGLKRPPRA